MPKCFVIQPFDSGKYDKRFEDVYSPAITATGLEPYRVDRDSGVDVPIEAIENGIRTAVVCLADITTDNPNVWYELGFAFAAKRQVVMVCSDERRDKRYPFDIQHRSIIPYQADSPRDFDNLKAAISKRIEAILKKTDALETIRDNEQVAPVHGLTQSELAVLATVAGNVVLPDEGASVNEAKRDVEQVGFTPLGFSLGLKRLRDKNFVSLEGITDYNGNDYQTILVTSDGWDWIEKNEDKFIIQRSLKPLNPLKQVAVHVNDDIPF
jgi:hypothetical protein